MSTRAGDTQRASFTAAPRADEVDLEHLARGLVGRCSLKDAQRVLRKAMIEEARSASGGSIHGAARLLGVDRRVIQRANDCD